MGYICFDRHNACVLIHLDEVERLMALQYHAIARLERGVAV